MKNIDSSVPVHLGRNSYKIFGKEFSFPGPSDPRPPQIKKQLKEQAQQEAQDHGLAVQSNTARMLGKERSQLTSREKVTGMPEVPKTLTNIPSMRATAEPITNPHTKRRLELEGKYARPGSSDASQKATRLEMLAVKESEWDARKEWQDRVDARAVDPDLVRARLHAADALANELLSSDATPASLSAALDRKRLIDGPVMSVGDYFQSLPATVEKPVEITKAKPRTALEPMIDE